MENQSIENSLLQPAQSPFPRQYREKETAKIIGKSVSWLQRKRWEGGGVPFIKDGASIFYLEEDIRDYLNSRPKFRSTSEIQKGGKDERKKIGRNYLAG